MPIGSRSFWLRVLNVYPEEWTIVKRLYLFQFFQGAGIAFFFTAVFARFLDEFSITELPWVMIYSALLLWLFGFIYTKLEHALRFVIFNILLIVFMAGSTLLFWGADFIKEGDWFIYLMMSWFHVLYFLNNMQFWGIAALAFDLRQSKRLFAVVSAGDIPAKFLGYTLALLLVPYTGTQHLLLIGAVFMLCSLFFLRTIVQSGKVDVSHHSHHHRKKKTHTPQKIGKLVFNIAANTYIRRIALISLLTAASVILINYGFYGEVKKAYHDDVALAKFIALFYGTLRFGAFVTKMVFTSRINASAGIKSALMITPVAMIIVISAMIIISGLSLNEQMVFYLFGISYVVVDVLRTAFNSPALLTLMQPLPVHERLKAHSIVKGIMDPFSSLLSGILLLGVLHFSGKVDLLFLCYILLVLGIFWVIGVVIVDRQYLQILFKTIGSRFFSSEEFNLNSEAMVQHVKNKIMTGNDIEVINILRILNVKEEALTEELITELLHHPSDNVKLETLRLIKNRRIPNIKGKLEELLRTNISAEVKNETIKTLCKIASGDWNLARYLADTNETTRKFAIMGMLQNDDDRIKEMAEAALKNLFNAATKESKDDIISILNEVKDEYHSPLHIQLIKDADNDIRSLAIMAVGTATDEKTLLALFDRIATNEKQVLAALHNTGNKALPLIREQLIQDRFSNELQEKFIAICGRISGDEGKQVLVDLLKEIPKHISVIIKALYRSKYAADADMQKQLEALAKQYLVSGVELLYMQRALITTDPRYNVLNSSLQQEIQEIREILLCLFGCLYDREQINHVKYGLNTRHKESIANAMEIIELTVRKDIGKQFNTMFENTTIEQRCTALSSLFTQKKYNEIEPVLEKILTEKPVHYHSWTKACSMYISKRYAHPVDSSLYKKYINSESQLLRETALFAM